MFQDAVEVLEIPRIGETIEVYDFPQPRLINDLPEQGGPDKTCAARHQKIHSRGSILSFSAWFRAPCVECGPECLVDRAHVNAAREQFIGIENAVGPRGFGPEPIKFLVARPEF